MGTNTVSSVISHLLSASAYVCNGVINYVNMKKDGLQFRYLKLTFLI